MYTSFIVTSYPPPDSKKPFNLSVPERPLPRGPLGPAPPALPLTWEATSVVPMTDPYGLSNI